MNTAQKPSLLHCSFTSKTTMQQAPLNDATANATTTQQPTSKPASLLDLARNKLRNNHATSSEKTVQQAHSNKGEDVAQIYDPQAERHQRVAEMLSDNKIAVLVEDATTDPVVVTVGIRGLATFELHIPLSRYDGIALLEVIDEYASEIDLNNSGEANPLPNAIELNQGPHSKPQRKVA